MCASDIEQRIHLSQPTISHHMAILTKAGVVEAKKLGLWVWYRRNEGALAGVRALVEKEPLIFRSAAVAREAVTSRDCRAVFG